MGFAGVVTKERCEVAGESCFGDLALVGVALGDLGGVPRLLLLFEGVALGGGVDRGVGGFSDEGSNGTLWFETSPFGSFLEIISEFITPATFRFVPTSLLNGALGEDDSSSGCWEEMFCGGVGGVVADRRSSNAE
jgi:hypothetical protein